MECGAVLDVCAKLALSRREELQDGTVLLERIASMLTKLMRMARDDA